MKTLIIGGVAGGATAAARIRRNDEQAEIILIERGQYISFANCGLPYHISGAIAEREQLLVTTAEMFRARYRVDVRERTEAIAIDRSAKTLRLRNLATGEEYNESYERLLLSPGAEPIRPKMPGIDSPRIFSLRNIPDLDRIMEHLKSSQPRRAVVVGGGFIGVEVAENLHERGIATTLVEGAEQIIAPLDPEMAAIVHAHLRDKKVALHLSDKIVRFEDQAEHSVVHLASGQQLPADMIVLAIGVRPETGLAREAGLDLGSTGGIKVNEYLQTSDPAIYAIGDAIEVTNLLSGKPALIPLAGPANRQARKVANNICFGNVDQYQGTLGTAILKVFDLAVAATGLNAKQLQAADVAHQSIIIHPGSHASYYPGARPLSLKLIFSPTDGKILGAQAVGADGADKRIDVIATAISNGMTVHQLSELELAYAPPYGSAKDPVNVAAYVAGNVLNGSQQTIAWNELQALAPAEIQLLDVRTAIEFELGSIDGARNIDVDQLRERLAELDPNKPVVTFCQVGLRGYLAQRILKHAGFTNVRNLSGGYKTYALAVVPQANPDLHCSEPNPATPNQPCSAVVPSATRQRLNAIGLQCPGPIMKTYQAMAALNPGEQLEITSSDPAFGRDLSAWAKKTGNTLLSVETNKGIVTALLQKESAVVTPEPSSCSTPARNKTTLVVFSADLDKVMASLIIANGALAMGKQVSIFFTFWGLNVLRRANPPTVSKSFMDKMFGAMMPAGVGKLNSISKMNFAGLGAKLIRKVMRDKHVDEAGNLLQNLVDQGAQLIACQMSMEVMGLRQEELIDGVEMGGVAAFLGEADESGTTLFI